MKLPLNIKLYEGKFFKDAVYYQIKKIIKKNHWQISLISGKNGIGKTTSVKTILNEKREKKTNLDQVDMTLYISLN
jgi:ABC-type Mn2+/Zn2+ transport system ATPase subunit